MKVRSKFLTRLSRLLRPGMEIKRWLLLGLVGMVLASLGITYIFVQIYRVQPFPEIVSIITLQWIDRVVRGVIFFLVGILCIVAAMLKLGESLLRPFTVSGGESVVDTIYNYRSRQRGARIVAIGGGTGLSVALRGLKEHTSNLTAIVTVADDGGSSGRLRRELGVLPPGDFRNCLVALADAPPLMERLFQHRFDHASMLNGSALDGHSFGNLFIVAMSEVTGNFEHAIEESSRVLAVRGQVLPSTISNVTLCAEMEDDEMVHGESNISATSQRIRRVYLEPARPPAYPPALKAIAEADLIVVGPGSLYTSVLPNLLADGMVEALRASRALRVYVCNVATQPGETDGYTIADHLEALLRHLPGQENLFHYIIANNHTGLPMPPSGRVAAVGPNGHVGSLEGSTIVLSDVVDEQNPVRHDSAKLAEAILRLYSERSANLAQPVTPQTV